MRGRFNIALLALVLTLSGCASTDADTRKYPEHFTYICEAKAESESELFAIKDEMFRLRATWRRDFGNEIAIAISEPLASLDDFSPSDSGSPELDDPTFSISFDMSWIGSTYRSLTAEVGTSGQSIRRPLSWGNVLDLRWTELERLRQSPGDFSIRLYSSDVLLRTITWQREATVIVKERLQSLYKSVMEKKRDKERLCERVGQIFLN